MSFTHPVALYSPSPLSVAVSAPGPGPASSKRAQIEDIAAKAAVAYVQKLFHFEIDDGVKYTE